MRKDVISILYAENEKSTREFVKLLFKKIDAIEVTYAQDAQEALKMYEQKHFDLVVTDIYMPNMNEFEFISEIKKIDSSQIFVIVTAMEKKEDLIKAIALRINFFLQKPIQKDEFHKTFTLATKIVLAKREHQKLQEEYEKQHETFERLLSKQKSLSCITNFSKTIFASDSFMQFFKISHGGEFDQQYRSLLELFICHPEYIYAKNKEELISLYEQYDENKRYIWMHKDGKYMSFKLELEEFKNSFYIVTLTDISALKEQQNHLSAELEQKLKLIEHQEDVILHQSKLAAMGEMLDAIAHQWMQPVSIIRMQSDLLKMTNKKEQVSQEELDEAMKNTIMQTEHLEETLQEFRSFFRPIENLVRIKLSTLLESIMILLKDELMKNQIEIIIQGDTKCEVAILPNEFKHVFINLINNAKDAYNDNKIDSQFKKINIFVQEFADKVTITLQDNAGGIPENILEHIFEPNVSSKKYGTGIGLYMSKQIIHKINGNIEVKNYKDGTVFLINIPKESQT